MTTRLVDSPACIVVEEGDMSGHLARLLKQAGQSAPASKPILEVNPEHGLVKKLDSAEGSERLVTWRRCSSTRRCWPRAGSWRIPPRTCGG